MTTDEKIERLQNQIDELCKRVDVLSGRCVCPQPQRRQHWEYEDYPWWDDYRQPCRYPKVWM